MKKIISTVLCFIIIITSSLSVHAQTAPLDEADIIAVGDLLCLNAQLSYAKRGSSYSFDYVFGAIKGDLASCDLAIGNLETCLAGQSAGLTTPAQREPVLDDNGEPVLDENGKPKTKTLSLPKINAPLSFADAIKNAGFGFVVTANNHTMDKGNSGVSATISALKERNIKFTGTSSDGDRHIEVMDINGIKTSILSYTMFINSGTEPPAHSYTVNMYSKSACAADIAAARELGADYVIVYIHWGDENRPVNQSQRITAQEIADAGADLILGSHPHVLQSAEYLRSRTDNNRVLCVYSLGNFISSMATVANKDTVTLHIKLRRWQSGRIDTVLAEYKPYYSGSRFEVVPASSAGKTRISSTLGDTLTPVNEFYMR